MLIRRGRAIRHDAVDELAQFDEAAVDVESRKRDWGVPDGVWWSVATLGGLLAGTAAMAWTFPLGTELAMAAFVSVCAGVSYAAARRWGHRQFGWPIVLTDGLKVAVAAACVVLLGEFVQDILRRWW